MFVGAAPAPAAAAVVAGDGEGYSVTVRRVCGGGLCRTG